jgi:hypothetical protein
VIKIKRGYGKHKGKLLFICLNCGRVGNFVAKFPYAKGEYSDDEENNFKEEHNNRRKSYRQKRGKYTKKMIFYSREDNISYEEIDGYVYDIEKEEFMFIAMDINSTDKKSEDNKK